MIPSVSTSSPNNWVPKLLGGRGKEGAVLVMRVERRRGKLIRHLADIILTSTVELVIRQHYLQHQLNY